jgi:Family of unknown function (DUF6445)
MAEDEYSFALKPTLDWVVSRVGREETPVITIDGVLQNPNRLVDYAAKEVSFDEDDDGSGGYPGMRAPAPLNYVRALVKAIDPLIGDIFELQGATLANAECSFCIVTTQREALHPLQSIPHIDTTYPLQFAILHYLCHDNFGGTAMYRQNATGIERVTTACDEAYRNARDAGLNNHPPRRDYIIADDSDYSQIAAFGAAFDRVIIYPSNLLHSGIISKATPLIPDPRQGRLTSNIFVTYMQK